MGMDKRLRSQAFLAICLLCSHPLAFAASKGPICKAAIYGKPVDSDCTALFENFTATQILQPRYFAEEQLRAEGRNLAWPGIDNPFGPPVVQVPKFYSNKTCNFAIMPYVNPLSGLGFALSISNWLSIKMAGMQLMAECLKKGKSSGGDFFVKDSTSTHPVLVIHMWASGARFELSLNEYENDPRNSAPSSYAYLGELGSNETHGGTATPSKVSSNESIATVSVAAVVGEDQSIDTS